MVDILFNMTLEENTTQKKVNRIPNGSTMRPMLDEMRNIPSQEVEQALDRVQKAKESDPGAGIFITKLNRPQMEVGGQKYDFYGARVLAKTMQGAQPFVTPHLHKHGTEPYYFNKGTGEMNFGRVVEASAKGQKQHVAWNPPVSVTKGDEFLIEEGQVHSFRNLAEEPVDFIFACPESHLRDNSLDESTGDRYIVRDWPGGIPVHFNRM